MFHILVETGVHLLNYLEEPCSCESARPRRSHAQATRPSCDVRAPNTTFQRLNHPEAPRHQARQSRCRCPSLNHCTLKVTRTSHWCHCHRTCRNCYVRNSFTPALVFYDAHTRLTQCKRPLHVQTCDTLDETRWTRERRRVFNRTHITLELG